MKKHFVLFAVTLFNAAIISQVNLTSSNLPIVVINTNGQTINDEPKITADMGIIDNGFGSINNITDPFNAYNGKIGIEIRGHSSQMFPKKQYGIELRDASGNSVNVSLLGMPAESDWVLNASFTDKTFLRNVLAYKLANEMGRYASRTAFCEVILNNEYIGLYILQEKIKRDKNRVNIKKLEFGDTSGDALTGGYILKIDRIDPGDKYFNSVFPSVYPKTPSRPSPISYIHVYPNSDNILTVQQDYIKYFITEFETSLSNDTYNHPFLGYYDYVDFDALVDYFLINEFAKSIDAYRLSTFMYKNRDSEGGKLVFGPIWDHDLSFGLADYGDAWLSSNWQADMTPYEGVISPPFWTSKIFNDPVIKNKLAKRWTELKNTVFNLSSILQYLDQVILDIKEARIRNFIQWPIIGVYQWPEYYVGNTYEEDVLYLKGWIVRRYNWMNANLDANYSDIIWKNIDLSQFAFHPNETVKIAVSSFVDSVKNLTSLQFVSSGSNLSCSIVNDSVLITPKSAGIFSFKIIAKNASIIKCISPEYKINSVTDLDYVDENIFEFTLNQNYPNPFNPSTTITFSVPSKFNVERSNVNLNVYDILGNKVAVLVNEEKQPGNYTVEFNAVDLPSGVYFYQLLVSALQSKDGKTGTFIQTKKMILMR
ncbi:MAG: CotH kinase family protein [Ignavibacteriaceae bacterium]|nr:CotH kinase family protein [Ignavibacteriaceae bacterium]